MSKKTLGVEQVIELGGKYPLNKKMSRMVIGSFFDEIKNTILDCKEVRLPGKGNGTISLVIKSRGMNSLFCMKRINSENIKNILKGGVKPYLSEFDVKKAAPNSLVGEFNILCSYPRGIMKNVSGFGSDKRSLLMEIY